MTKSFNNWLQAFCIFSSVLCEKCPSKSSGLLQHIDIIPEAYKHFGGSVWFSYNESFRQKLAVHPSLKWGVKDMRLWLNIFLSQGSAFIKQSANVAPTSTPGYRKAICFNLNDGHYKWPNSCKCRHECAFCARGHLVSKCFKKMSAANQQHGREVLPKGSHPSEVASNFLARVVC